MTARKQPAQPKGKPAPAAKKAATKPSAKPAPPAAASHPAKGKTRPHVEWAAVEADHNTGKYTDGKLAEIHGLSREAIVRKRKRDQKLDPRRWQKDLSDQVRQATNALLLREQVTAERSQFTETITDGHTATAILTAAEVAKSVVIGQRVRVSRALDVTMRMLDELDLATSRPDDLADLIERVSPDMDAKQLAEAQQKLRDFLRLHNRVGSVHRLMDALGKAQALERQAFNMDDPAKKPTEPPPNPADVAPGTEVEAYRAWVGA